MAFTYFRDLGERLRRPGGPPFYFRIANLVVAVLMIVMAIVFFTWGEFGRIMLGIFEIVFAIWMIMFELAELAWLTPLVRFMFTWRGRGLFYVFVGCLTLGYRTVGWVFGAIIIAIGVVYIVLSFTSKKNESYIESAAQYPAIASDTMYYQNSVNVQKAGSIANVYGSSGDGSGAQYLGDHQPHKYGTQSTYMDDALHYGQPQPPQPAQRIQPQHQTNQYAPQRGFNQFEQHQQISPTHKTEPRTDHLHSPI
ncbi:hypothetical protein IW140_002654 [Coemansia sp. RSA 1813]|nr:hypothetical protein EV178_000269 [Coemansia sp. RSA 1646]KAJ1772085.1 hypothetical protein LPJ74_001821 [Coemansia sp. RSA 1843]KAJ2090423.1 hypothetical protein IW138_002634 [Coemansia sp. RSA 986]KAJ2215389.1 hypothetical protein EV179_002173 [Coemansia sp. RSA 487]KAJ2569978.1 hypothetical protein IW140_002654 [Coemansia sp. RSA 1813]